MAIQKILIAVDGGPVAAEAADVGVELARALGAQVALVSVVDRSAVDSLAPEMPRDEMLAEARSDAKRVMTMLAERLGPDLVTADFMPEGQPGHEIVGAAKAWPADMIVVGSHGRTGLDRVILGSVAEQVMRHAPCPVLVVRAKG